MENKLIVLTEVAYKNLSDKLDSIIQTVGVNNSTPKDDWLSNDQVMELLKVSKSTLQTYRDKGVIPFSQIGRKIIYKKTEVALAIERFKVPAYRISKSKS
ncbi:MAG: helix-turn-helix domain-containing protein [Bacteroidetes bacterium]|nr:helix-turn-helix domain-containing protein [Bacteroidota bacterium]